jgi:RNA polymerase sigma-70 factor (ECF subfamily)
MDMGAGIPRNHEEFKQEMVPHMDLLYNYAMYLTGERAAAQDLLQDTFLKAFRFFDKFERGTNARAWLYRIMRNTYINEFRRLKRSPELIEYDEQVSPYQMDRTAIAAADDLRQKMDSELFDDEIAGAIGALPEKFKSVVILRDVEDLPYEEIAEVLEIPVGTVRSRLHRARAMLFERLRPYARARGYRVPDRFVSGEEFAMAV